MPGCVSRLHAEDWGRRFSQLLLHPPHNHHTAMSDYYSFDRALCKLRIEEEDLKRLIAAGEIRAFRGRAGMTLRAEDVDRVAEDLAMPEEPDAAEEVAEELNPGEDSLD